MSLSNSTLSEIHATLPIFKIVKDKINIDGIDVDNAIRNINSLFEGAKVDRIDGIKFTWNDKWVHIRKSNTEPILRIYAEAPNRNQAKELVDKVKMAI
tara:strand:- start:193 stop:486 length:294 start_codon:yes stop_codon:yes gene_type:complete